MKKDYFMRKTSFILLLILMVVSLCAKDQAKYPMEAGYVGMGFKEMASSPISMVTSPHPFATRAALEMLSQGGNAVDAACAMLAATSLGAIWCSCAPEFGSEALVDRLSQVKPKVLSILVLQRLV